MGFPGDLNPTCTRRDVRLVSLFKQKWPKSATLLELCTQQCRLNHSMKKLMFLLAVFLGMVTVSQAGFALGIGLGLPLPLPTVVVRAPVSVVVGAPVYSPPPRMYYNATAPAYYQAAPRAYYPAPAPVYYAAPAPACFAPPAVVVTGRHYCGYNWRGPVGYAYPRNGWRR
jgi:hypothetical protein